MRIGIVCPYSLFRPGGVQEHVKAQSEELKKRGHEVFILTPRPRDFTGLAPEGVVFVGTSVKVRAQSSTVDISAPIETEEINTILEPLKLNILHLHEAFVPFISRQLAIQAKCPTVGTLHAAVPETLIGRSVASIKPYMRSVLQSLDAITAVSPAATSHVKDMVESVHFVPNGISDKYLANSKSSVSRDPATVLFIGRLEKRKGAKYLIDAFEHVLEQIPNAKCLIAGDGQLRATLERYVKDRGIGNIKFLGYVDDDKKIELLKQCSVYASPAIYGESFGIVLLEAMALGAPIVAHPNPGYEWVMKDMGRLSLVDVKNKEEFARRLVLMIEEDRIRKEWQAWAKSYVKQYSYKKIVENYEKIYRDLIK